MDKKRPYSDLLFSILCSYNKFFNYKLMNSTLEMIGIASAIVDSNGNIMDINAPFQRAFDCIFIPFSQQIQFHNDVDNEKFSLELKNIVAGVRNTVSIPLKETQNDAFRSLHMIAIRPSQEEVVCHDSVLLVLSGKGGQAPDADHLKVLYNFTPAEIRVCSQLMAGKSAHDISSKYGTSIHTVRNQIKSILAKTGMPSQAALIALLNNPAPTGFDF